MFPSSQTGSGINSSFGLVPISGRSSSGSADETRSLAFNWLGHLTGHGGGLFDEQTSGLKAPSDQMMDRSFMSIDRHTPSVPRRTPHSNVGGTSGQPGTDATQPPHHIPDPAMVNAFHPYRLVSDGLSAAGHPSLTTSQFAAFDSLYKAYQGAYGSAAPGGVFGTQPFRFDSPLLADQRMMLQASLLQYPHLGIFPNAALYPGLPGTGVRYPNDYYGQNLPGMSLSSKYPDVGGPSWLGLDRSMSLLDRDKEPKEAERKNDLDLSKRPDKDDHHRGRSDRDEMTSMRRDPKDDRGRCEDMRRDAAKHASDKKEQQKRSNSLKSPIRQEGHQSTGQDVSLKRCNSGGPSDFSYNSGRGGHIVPPFGMSTDLSSLPKMSSSPGGATSQQRQTTARSDRTIEPVQDHARAKDRHHHHHHHHHHHGWKPEDAKAKMAPLVLTVPKTTASASTNGQQPGKSFEKKFHRPFEHAQANSSMLPTEKPSHLPMHGLRDNPGKNSRGSNASSDYLARSAVETKTNESYRFLQQQQQQYQQQQQQQRGGKVFEPKLQSHTATQRKQGTGSMARCEEAPLNLVVTKSQAPSCVSVVPTVPADVPPVDGFELGQVHRAPLPPLVPPSHTLHPDLGQHEPTWPLAPSDNLRAMPKQAETHLNPVVTPSKAPVSKLDLEAKRRACLRKSESCGNEDEEEEEEEEEEEDEDLLDNSKELARLLLILSGPPLKEPCTAVKSKFLAMFGLASLDSNKEMVYERRKKRRKLFHERSITPSLIDDSEDHEPYTSEGSSYRNELAQFDKHSFLRLFNLQSVRSQSLKRKVAGVADCGKMGDLYCEASSSHPAELGTVTCLSQPISSCSANHQYNPSPMLSRSDLKQQQPEFCRPKENCLGSAFGSDAGFDVLSDGGRPFAGPSDTPSCADRWAPTSDAERHPSCDGKSVEQLKGRLDSYSALSHASEDHRQLAGGFPLLNSVSDGHFAKEGQLDASPFNVNSRNASTPSSTSRDVANGQALRVADHQTREPAFHWPGLEAIIESYHHYVEEQTMEKQLLREQSQRLRHHNTDLMFTAERLRTRMSELLHSKQQMIEERLKIQSFLDGLKDSLKQFL